MRTMLEETSDKVGVVKQLVVHMIHTNDARALVLSALQNDRNDMLRLKKEMGAVLRPILGLSNGYYVLDMAKEMDRLCLKKLLEVSGTLTKTRLEKCPLHGRTADYSQHGNRSSFRNEMLNSEPVVISPAFVNPVPVRGKLEFDFSGNDRPPKEAMATSDQRIIKTLLHHFLLPPEKCPSALYKLMLQKELGEGTLGCNGITYYETPMDRAKQISDFSDKFYNNLHTRLKAFEDAVEKEGLPLELNEKGEFCDSFERDKFQIPDHFAILLERIQKQDEASDKHSSFVNSISEVDSDDDSSLNITMDRYTIAVSNIFYLDL